MKNDNTEKDLNNKDSERDEITRKAKFLRERIAKVEEIQRLKREKEARRDYRREIEAKKTIVNRATNGWIASSEELAKKSMDTTPSLVEKLRPSRTKRDIIPFIVIAMITLSCFIYFSYQDSTGSIAYSPEVPVINIDVSSEITNESQQCFLKFSPISNQYVNSRWANHYLAADIRKRGSNGGYSFELYQNENLFQIRNDDDWLLLPPGNYLDSLRTKLAFEVYNMIQGNSSKYRLPETKFVEVYINGIDQGLYLLSERIDRKMLDFDQENVVNPEENDIIFKVTNWDGDFYTIPNNSENSWEQLFPNSISFSHIPIDLTENVLYTAEKDFYDEEDGVFSIFNKSSIIDNLLFGLLLGHDIIEGSNYYLVLDHDSQDGFFFIPWNFAQSWGYYKHGKIPTELWLDGYENYVNSVVWSNIYYRLIFPKNSTINDSLMIDLINRWNFLRTDYWSSNNLIAYFNGLYRPIQNTLIRSLGNTGLITNIISTVEDFIMTRVNLMDNIFGDIHSIFSDTFKPPYRGNSEVFGFSSPAARRYYYKSSNLFSTEVVHEVHVTIQRKYLNDMLARKRDTARSTDRVYMPSHVEIDEYSVENTGFRIRGTYNRLYPKDSFKLKFSEPDMYIGEGTFKKFTENEGRRFLGLRRLNLRAAPVDFSFMNEVAGYELYKILGYPCPRVSWAKLYITETDETGHIVKSKDYKGLYLLTEDIDKTFLRYNFKNPEGNLYKTTDIKANLEDTFVPWVGSQVYDIKEFYSFDGSVRVYELRTNEEQDDYTDLEKFIQYINHNWSNIEQVTNLTLLGKYFAASNFQGNWDDYVFLPHNYFLYSDPICGFVLIPWDIENNFNMGFNSVYAYFTPFAPDFRNASLLSGYEGWFDNISLFFGIDPSPRPLWDNLITDIGFLNPYNNSHQKILDNMTTLRNQIITWFNLITPAVTEPFSHTDPSPPPATEWYPDVIPIGWFVTDINRVNSFLDGRTQFVIDNLP